MTSSVPAVLADPVAGLLDEILKAEGWPVYTDHPADRGGPTKGGITLATLSRWRGRPCTADDVENLTRTEAVAIYRRRYVEDPGYAGIADAALRHLVVDSAVLFGCDNATPWLQSAANDLGAALAVDGAAGPKTLAAVNRLDAMALQLLVIARRMERHGRVVTDDARARGRTADQALFGAGWMNRLGVFVRAAAANIAAAS